MAEGLLEKENRAKVYRLSIKKIVVIGPESTGKSSLSQALALHLNTVWVPEYARTYLEALNQPYQESDLLNIAKGQLQAEDQLQAQANRFLICDTDLYVIKVWSEHSYQRCSQWVLQQIAIRSYDLYLLSDIDIPWTSDPLREHPEITMRNYFYQVYLDIVQNSGVPFQLIHGNHEKRRTMSLNAISRL